MRILITGGSGFIGFNLSQFLQEKNEVVVIDNLSRMGSEINVKNLIEKGIDFKHGDVRVNSDLNKINNIDVVIHCASDASVVSGIYSNPRSIIENNLFASINVIDFAVRENAKLIFFSTNRVYSAESLINIPYLKDKKRFIIDDIQENVMGLSKLGISEKFNTNGYKSFYGNTKFSIESLLQEYGKFKNLKYLINRFGVVSGPGQFGVGNQGIVSFWLKSHILNQKISYIGYEGFQVRDVLHVDDLCKLIGIQLSDEFIGEIYNVGGGFDNSFSLLELTDFCQEISGNKLSISTIDTLRDADIPIYFTNNIKVMERYSWSPNLTIKDVVVDLNTWYSNNIDNISYF